MNQPVFDPVLAPPHPYLAYVKQAKDEENKKRCAMAQVQGNPLLVTGCTYKEHFYRLTARRRADDIVAL
jgi:hypothetical protein